MKTNIDKAKLAQDAYVKSLNAGDFAPLFSWLVAGVGLMAKNWVYQIEVRLLDNPRKAEILETAPQEYEGVNVNYEVVPTPKVLS